MPSPIMCESARIIDAVNVADECAKEYLRTLEAKKSDARNQVRRRSTSRNSSRRTVLKQEKDDRDSAAGYRRTRIL